jgi:SNF2 family DNA or RNA helicase
MIRRMKTTLLDGKRLIELPEKIVTLVKLEFSAEERDIYKMVWISLSWYLLPLTASWGRWKRALKLLSIGS